MLVGRVEFRIGEGKELRRKSRTESLLGSGPGVGGFVLHIRQSCLERAVDSVERVVVSRAVV